MSFTASVCKKMGRRTFFGRSISSKSRITMHKNDNNDDDGDDDDDDDN